MGRRYKNNTNRCFKATSHETIPLGLSILGYVASKRPGVVLIRNYNSKTIQCTHVAFAGWSETYLQDYVVHAVRKGFSILERLSVPSD